MLSSNKTLQERISEKVMEIHGSDLSKTRVDKKQCVSTAVTSRGMESTFSDRISHDK
jgi:hypothetical protein